MYFAFVIHLQTVIMVNERTIFLLKTLLVSVPLLHIVGIINFIASWTLQRKGDQIMPRRVFGWGFGMLLLVGHP